MQGFQPYASRRWVQGGLLGVAVPAIYHEWMPLPCVGFVEQVVTTAPLEVEAAQQHLASRRVRPALKTRGEN